MEYFCANEITSTLDDELSEGVGYSSRNLVMTIGMEEISKAIKM